MARSLNKKFFGPTADAGSQLVAMVKFDDGAAAQGYIVKQVSARRYLFAKVSDPSVTVKAKLVNLATPTAVGTASIAVVPFGGSTEYAFKITAKKVSTFSGNSYVWGTFAADKVGEANIIPVADLGELTATAYAVLETTGPIATLTMTDAGADYVGTEVLTLTGGATITVSTVDVGGEILTFAYTTNGTGYEVGDVLAVTGGSVAGLGASFTVASITASVDSFVVTEGGSGYTSAPAVTVSGNATATAVVVGGIVTEVNVTLAGSGYTSAPTVTIAAP